MRFLSNTRKIVKDTYKEPEKTPRQILTDMLCDGNIIDCYLAEP